MQSKPNAPNAHLDADSPSPTYYTAIPFFLPASPSPLLISNTPSMLRAFESLLDFIFLYCETKPPHTAPIPLHHACALPARGFWIIPRGEEHAFVARGFLVLADATRLYMERQPGLKVREARGRLGEVVRRTLTAAEAVLGVLRSEAMFEAVMGAKR